MIPVIPLGANHKYDATESYIALHVRVGEENAKINGMDMVVMTVASAWEPTPAELKILNAGGKVIINVWGNQPPMNVTVE